MKEKTQLTPLQEQLINELFTPPKKNEKLNKILLAGIPICSVLMMLSIMLKLPFLITAIPGLAVMTILMTWVSIGFSKAGSAYSRKTMIACLKRLEQQGELETLREDCRNATEFLGMKLGLQYIVCINTGVIVRYDEIRNVHQYVHKTNFIEDGRELRAIRSDGQTVALTGLALRGKADEQVQKAVAFLLLKNPSITVGH